MQKYTSLQLIGRGSTGKVYRAQRCSDAQVVALKLMTAMDDDMLNCRRQEFEVLRGLSHPNIVQGLEFFSFPGSAVVVLSYHPGSTLTKAVQEAEGACLPEWQAQHLFCKLLSAIDYLHQRQIAHRDLKSDNVLVSEDVRELTLADFSTASVASAGESLTMTGTQEWSAPEVLDWEATPDEKNDIWGAGLCLNFMLAGELPRRMVDFSSVRAFADAARRDPTSFSGAKWKCLTPACQMALTQCLMISKDHRPTACAILQSMWCLSTICPEDSH